MSTSRDERMRREQRQQVAYEMQHKGAVEGAIRWTLYGIVACGLGHYYSPFFRRQTWGLKAFLTSSSTIFGLVVGADYHLLDYEHNVRKGENDMRREARNALAREGKIATEGEIRKWRQRRDADLANGGDGTGSSLRSSTGLGIGEMVEKARNEASRDNTTPINPGRVGTQSGSREGSGTGKEEEEKGLAGLPVEETSLVGVEALAGAGLEESISKATGATSVDGTQVAAESGMEKIGPESSSEGASGLPEAVISGGGAVQSASSDS
ncbi:hypothetical protein BCR39DRAFT_515838 [Naematelia encephala]|uniref:HIG1 domain-containing protein n=1 Tax=Naematelia encephala TaxID=71784 RepID=A0A1Y2BK39_9TREE|nr:hypothetical protein BCR39DRAFT_515838 [Naematelia encephala]